MVLSHSLPPRWLLSGERVLTPQSLYSVDLRMKISILNVCKAWYQAGIELLYESILLRSIGQLPAFVRALEGRAGLGSLVKHLNVSCMVPRGFSLLFTSEAQKIFQLCPRLSHFGFVPTFLIPFLLISFPAMSSGITSLEFSNAVDFSVVFPLLFELCGSLRSLSVALPKDYNNDKYPQLAFPYLEEFRVDLTFNFEFSRPDAEKAIRKWSMLNLRRFWITDPVYRNQILAQMLVEIYGRNVTFLSVYTARNPPTLQAILDKCPALEHLVGEVSFPYDTESIFVDFADCHHPKLKYFDIWYSWDAPRSLVDKGTSRPTFNNLKKGFPELRACRCLDITFKHLWDLPMLFPPTDFVQPGEPGEEKDICLMFSGPWLDDILEFTNSASMLGRVLPEVDFSDGEEGSDQSFVVDREFGDDSDPDDYSDSDSGSCITVSEGGVEAYLDEFYSEDNWEVGREEALEIFSRIIDDQLE
ncbi:hypothetical protein B0H11DRAFT_310226 [Mycena galericulata]|nr:hypothetical protein B0H11DRAFT_310226 [Mycena galericulata]